MAQQKTLNSWRNHAHRSYAAYAEAAALLDEILVKKMTHDQIKTKIRQYKIHVGGFLRLPQEKPHGAK